MILGDLDQLCINLEKQELEANNGTASPTVYGQLLAIYLYQNDLQRRWLEQSTIIHSAPPGERPFPKGASGGKQIGERPFPRGRNRLINFSRCNAKFLWKRIPPNIVSSNAELAAVWLIGQKMWKKDLPGTYRAIAGFAWTEPLSDIIKALEDKIRERAFNLIGRSYSSISLDTVSGMTGITLDNVAAECRGRGWQLSEDGVTVAPAPPPQPSRPQTSSEDQLFKLTEFVSFLEN